MHSIHTQNRHINLHALQEGLRDGVPIALGYLAVSFSLGIAAQAAGLTPFQGFLAYYADHKRALSADELFPQSEIFTGNAASPPLSCRLYHH